MNPRDHSHDHDATRASTTEGLPVAPSMGPALEAVRAPFRAEPFSLRAVALAGAAVLLGIVAGLVAQVLSRLIGLITHLSYFGTTSTELVPPWGHHLGAWAVLVPVAGGIVVGLMARYGSKAIRGHGIPEAMEQVLFNRSRIPPRMVLLKPVSAAVAIGTGGPFGAEGPIIATGGALGSLLGQLVHITADERKTLLAAGAAAGMAATFGTPVSAVLLAVELLLFEYRPRSVIPVALATAVATGVRLAFDGPHPAFPMPEIAPAGGWALASYLVVGAVSGLLAVVCTRIVYWVEDAFEKLPVHWMWWPALGGLAVGLVGLWSPRTLGVGYANITDALSGNLAGGALAALVLWKFVSWSIALGSGTSGGTLAPLFTFGSGVGALCGAGLALLFPHAGVDPRVAALVGMAATFAGASRALLASVVFAFETTRQPAGLLPLLAGCSVSFLVSALLMRHSIMTEKIVRRGVQVSNEYAVDWLAQVTVREHASRKVATLAAEQTLGEARTWLHSRVDGSQHQGFPVLDGDGRLVGVLTRRDLLDPRHADGARLRTLVHRPLAVVYEDNTMREAADHMVREGVGRLPVVRREDPTRVVGIVTRNDLLVAHHRRLEEAHQPERGVMLPTPPRGVSAPS